MPDAARILDRLIEACTTGKPCRLSRGVDAISPKGLGLLVKQGVWPQAVDAIMKLDAVHPMAQLRFVKVWCYGWLGRPSDGIALAFSQCIEDQDLFFAFLRKIMPPYHGGDEFLFRGQPGTNPVGASWSLCAHVALKFALFGYTNVDAITLALNGRPKRKIAPRENAVILSCAVPAKNIISAPCWLNGLEGQFIVDPRRGLEIQSEPASEAFDWVRQEVREMIDGCALLMAELGHIGRLFGAEEDEPMKDAVERAAWLGNENAQALIDGGMLDMPVVPKLWKRLRAIVSGSDPPT